MILSHVWTIRENENNSELRYKVKTDFNETATTQILDVEYLGCFDNGKKVNIYPNNILEKYKPVKLIIDRTTNHAIQILKNGDVGGSFEITSIE